MKKIALVVIVFILIGAAFWIGFKSGGKTKSEADYSSISSFEKNTGNSFYNFYEPKWYLSREKNKQSLKKLDEVSIKYGDDNTKQEYWISYENLDQYNTYIYLGVDRSEVDWEYDNKEIVEQDGYRFETAIYNQSPDWLRVCEVHYIDKEKKLGIIVELGTKSSNPMNDELMLQNCIDMIVDSFELN